MPRVAQAIIGTSLFLYPDRDAAERGAGRGGSGVLVGVPGETLPVVHLYAVTNAHVINAGAVVARAMNRSGKPVFLEPDWETHPSNEDVAVGYCSTVPENDDGPLQWVPSDWLAEREDLGIAAHRKDWPSPWPTGPIVPGEETLSVTRFVGYDGAERNVPMVRFGNLATAEPLVLRQENGHDQESLLVEARSLTGFSGAPVFAYRANTYFDGGVPPVGMAVMLGVGWTHLKHPKDEEAEFTVEFEKPGGMTPGRYNSGIMALVPAWHLAQLLKEPNVATVRQAKERALMDVANSDGEFDPF